MKKQPFLLGLVLLTVVCTSGCQTLRELGSLKPTIVRHQEPTISAEDIPDLNAMYAAKQTPEQAFHRVQSYCAGVVQDHRQRQAQKRTRKNIFATLGVIAGTIIAPTLAQGSAIKAWAGVSGASAGALSTLFDSAEGENAAGLAQTILEMSGRFGVTEQNKQDDLVRDMLFFCRVNEARMVQNKTDAQQKPATQATP